MYRIGEIRSFVCRGLRNILEERGGSSGGKDIIFKKFGCVCKRKIEGVEYMDLRYFFKF